MIKKPTIYVIVPLFDRFEFVERLLSQLAAQSYSNHRLVLIDHGRKRLPLEMRTKEMIYLEGSIDDWWSGAINIGLRHVLEVLKVPDTDFILLQNDDVIFGTDLLSGLLAVQKENNRSVVSAITIERGTDRILDGHNLLSYLQGKHISPLRGKSLDEVNETRLHADVLKGRGVLYPVRAAREIGYTDERLHYRADPEWSFRARKAGYELLVVPEVTVETVLDTQEGARCGRGFEYFKDFVFSKRSTQNLYSAKVYFQLCFGSIGFAWPFFVHSLRTILIGFVQSLKG
ncbi:MAG: glycosyltransferase [Verrucomicrobiota bacterium]